MEYSNFNHTMKVSLCYSLNIISNKQMCWSACNTVRKTCKFAMFYEQKITRYTLLN